MQTLQACQSHIKSYSQVLHPNHEPSTENKETSTAASREPGEKSS